MLAPLVIVVLGTPITTFCFIVTVAVEWLFDIFPFRCCTVGNFADVCNNCILKLCNNFQTVKGGSMEEMLMYNSQHTAKFEFSHPELSQGFALIFVRKKTEFLAANRSS